MSGRYKTFCSGHFYGSLFSRAGSHAHIKFQQISPFLLQICQFNLPTRPGTLRGSKKISLFYITQHRCIAFIRSFSAHLRVLRHYQHFGQEYRYASRIPHTESTQSMGRDGAVHMTFCQLRWAGTCRRAEVMVHSGGTGAPSSRGLRLNPWR